MKLRSFEVDGIYAVSDITKLNFKFQSRIQTSRNILLRVTRVTICKVRQYFCQDCFEPKQKNRNIRLTCFSLPHSIFLIKSELWGTLTPVGSSLRDERWTTRAFADVVLLAIQRRLAAFACPLCWAITVIVTVATLSLSRLVRAFERREIRNSRMIGFIVFNALGLLWL